MSSESHDSRPARSRCHPEALRCFFCLFVVFGHAYLEHIELAILAVVGFLTMSVGFALEARDSSRLIRKTRTILGIWLWWWIPYAVLLGVRGVEAGVGPIGLAEPYMLVTGPSIHLWYLPALAATYGFLILMRDRAQSRVVASGSVLVTIAVASGLLDGGLALPTPVPQALVTVFALAGTLMTAMVLPDRLNPSSAVLGYLSVATGSVLVVVMEATWLPYLLATVGSLLLCRCAQPAPPRWLASAAALAGGVYLVHVIPLSACRWLGLPNLEAFAVALPASVMAVVIARRTSLRRYF